MNNIYVHTGDVHKISTVSNCLEKQCASDQSTSKGIYYTPAIWLKTLRESLLLTKNDH